MQTSDSGSSGRRALKAAQVIVVSSVMFTFISYWRTAAVVLCDLASTAYYIGGIVEGSVGAAAPWFILGVMLFSYIVRGVYIESCTLFVRGGVYRIVREAMGGTAARVAVSALMFDYILTGPISGVSAGQYIIGLVLDVLHRTLPLATVNLNDDTWKQWGSVVIASVVTIYFYRQNLIGIHESSDKAVKIMIATTIMAAVIAIWCGATLLVKGPVNSVPLTPQLSERHETLKDPLTDQDLEIKKENPLGFLKDTKLGEELVRLDQPADEKTGQPAGKSWWSLIGAIGVFIAFGHSILAMSGEETLAQVYREVESPKLQNFKKAAFIVFMYSLVFTAGISFLAVMMIPEGQRLSTYSQNLISGLAMNVIGPIWARLILQGFVVVVGFLILSGAVNTAIIGSNGVLNRVAEDGVLPDWFLKPHPKYGTTNRMLTLILVMQLVTIIGSHGKVELLGEAYAFGVVWSFVFMTLAMLILRFKMPVARQFKVPFNVRIGKVELPIGLALVFGVLFVSAIMNLLTKDVATKAGLAFSGSFLAIFTITEYVHRRKRGGKHHEHVEQFNQQTTGQVSLESLGIDKPFRKLVAIRSPQNLFMLEKALQETDPSSTAVVVMTAKLETVGEPQERPTDLDSYDQHLMSAVVERAEKAGKHVTPLIVPTNNPLFAVIKTAQELGAQEVIVGLSNKHTADEQLDQIAFYWFNVQGGQPVPLTVRILSRDRDVHLDLHGGSRIPKVSQREAKTVAELRAAGVGIDRVLLLHDGTQISNDLFEGVLTMLDPEVVLDIAQIPCGDLSVEETHNAVMSARTRAHHLGRELDVQQIEGDIGAEVVKLARQEHYSLIVFAMPSEGRLKGGISGCTWGDHVLNFAHCPVFLAAHPAVPTEIE